MGNFPRDGKAKEKDLAGVVFVDPKRYHPPRVDPE